MTTETARRVDAHETKAVQPEADPAPRTKATRFDQRGIALQTVIIMVVMLAIAGGVAAVLFSRGQSATQQLESQNIVAASAKEYTSSTLCNSVEGLNWTASNKCKYESNTACEKVGGKQGDGSTVVAGGASSTTKCYTRLDATGIELGEIGTS